VALRAGVRVFSETEVPQGSEAWRTIRLGCLTGSRCSPVMVEKRPSATRDTLLAELIIERRTHRSARKEYQTDAMEQGIDREAEARREVEAEMGDVVTQVGFCYWVGRYMGCSPDGVVGPFDELVSIKCRELRAHYDHVRYGTIPADARRQMAHEMLVTGCRVHNYCSFNPDFEPALRYRRVRMTWEQLEVDAYAKAAEAFMREVETELQVIAQMVSGSPWAEALKETAK
jgi:hypothetical protein